jgi:hypothetical protein
MRPELLKQAIAKFDSVFFQAASPLAAGNTEFSEKRKKSLQTRWWRESTQFIKWERIVRNAPDDAFERLMSELDGMPAQIQKAFKEAAANIPRNRGGRPPNFSLKERQQAIQELGKEITDGNSFSESVEAVARRKGMEQGCNRTDRNRDNILFCLAECRPK